MKKLMITTACFLCLLYVRGQKAASIEESPSFLFNKFQDFIYTTHNEDSAFYFAKKLASNKNYIFLLRDLIHSSFAQEFIERDLGNIDSTEANILKKQKLYCKEILLKMFSDSTELLKETVTPVYLLIKIQEAKNNLTELLTLTNRFIATELSPSKMYDNRNGRYALMIYQIIVKYPQLKAPAQQIFTTVKADLQSNQVKITDSSSRTDLDKRAWYRYMYAYINYLEANDTKDDNQKENFLRTAFEYSPDLIDKNHSSAYFYDAVFLLGEQKMTFQDDYLHYLTNKAGDKNKVLPTLLQMALSEPEYKDTLKLFYNNNNLLTGKSFDKYWNESVNAQAKPAPAISLTLMDGKSFSSKKLLGKWVLVDFWGTWCGPCREEHPDMQKLYDSTILSNTDKISLLTIACNDSNEKVLQYMKEKNFSFPVAMSDKKIEEIYTVQGYPTKLLITPEGNYITVPFNIDWVNFIKQYSNL